MHGHVAVGIEDLEACGLQLGSTRGANEKGDVAASSGQLPAKISSNRTSSDDQNPHSLSLFLLGDALFFQLHGEVFPLGGADGVLVAQGI